MQVYKNLWIFKKICKV